MKGKTISELIHIKNSSAVLAPSIQVSESHSLSVLVKKLYREGYLITFKPTNTSKIEVVPASAICFKNFKPCSKPSNKKYLSKNKLQGLNARRENLFISTPAGVQTLSECKRKRLGGVLLFTC